MQRQIVVPKPARVMRKHLPGRASTPAHVFVPQPHPLLATRTQNRSAPAGIITYPGPVHRNVVNRVPSLGTDTARE